ncbi:MAG: DUF5671 domain-containing protein [bacterium]|nr:DUF5671 domain-containing protein [bacterium]
MQDKPKLTPKDFFLYAGALITLYWSAGALIALLFTTIDRAFYDQLSGYVDPYSGGIRFAIASLIVVFPISLFLFYYIKREILRAPEKLLLPLRRWLYALTIFVTSAALLGDLIALINQFLGGELTTRFVLKAISIFVVAGFIFWYCLLEIRTKPGEVAGIRKGFLAAAIILVLASIVYGFAVMGSPSAIRKLRFDERRVSDLQSIQWQIVNYWQQKVRFPKSLSDLNDPISGYIVPNDPRTKAPYEFRLGEGYAFELCANFELASSANQQGPSYPYPVMNGKDSNDTWQHEAGRTCFERVLDPERYPPLPKTR